MTSAKQKKQPAPEPTVEEIRTFFRANGELSPQGVARKSGLHRNTLNSMDESNWNPTTKTRRAIGGYINTFKKEKQNGKK